MKKAGKVFGPFSKYDKTLPYTYSAEVYAIEGHKDLVSNYFSDTICGLIEFLDEQNIPPQDVDLIGHYLDKDIPLEKKYCLTQEGRWLKRPDICNSLEEHYKKTLDELYKGHIELGECSFEDRDREGY